MKSRFLCLSLLIFSISSGVDASMPKSAPSGEEVYRLNCGAEGWDFTDPRGNFWLKDEAYTAQYRWGFENGTSSDSGIGLPIPLTDIPEVYRTHRWGGADMKYRVELPNGQYDVTLHFAETYWSAAGARVFDVALQGQVVLSQLDVFARAGGKARPFSQRFVVTVSDEKLDVTFPRIYADNALVSGIEIKVHSVSDENVLAFMARKMFWYFWNEVGPGTGLVSDKSNNWNEQHFSTASIATTGFGLSALTVACERGWISPSAARARVHTTLQFFRQMQLDPNRSYHGMWYHFVDWTTGHRNYGCEVSTVDSALFILGALQAGEYFRSTDPTIAQKAEEIYRAMEWDWFTQRGGDIPFVSMGWTPETGGISAPDRGSFIRAWWNMYAETVFVDLLALGSPTYPIDPRAWVEMRRHGSNAADGGVYEYMHLPPLFVHQYHNLYYDFRGKHDGMADYWDAAVRATQRDRSQCALDSRYETDIWGLTACETQNKGYQVYGTEPDGGRDGTSAPTGPLASLPMTPTESIASARKMFFQYKHAIWGRHGFTDSFNTSTNERSESALGLDNGPILLAIENFRTNLIRETFMRSPFVATALSRAGFVTTGAAPRHFSHSEKNGNHARFAFDNDLSTRWESTWTDGNWLSVDYGKPTSFDHVRLLWETAHGTAYRIQTSDNGQTWTTVATVTSGDGGEDVVRFSRATARMIRMYGDQRGGSGGNVWGYSLFEMQPGIGLPPVAPTALTATIQNWNTVRWSWSDNAADETHYRIYTATTAAGPFTLAQELPANSAAYVETGVRPGVAHYARVTALNSESESDGATGSITLPSLFTALGPTAADGTIRSALDHSGVLHVTFYDPALLGLRYATWNGTVWSSGELVDSSASGYPAADGSHTFLVAQDLAVDSLGRPQVVYYSGTGELRWGVRENGVWRKETLAPVDASVVPSLVVDPSGGPHVVWSVAAGDAQLRYGRRTASGWLVEPVAGGVSANTSHVALDETGRLHVAYGSNDFPHALYYTHRGTTSWAPSELIDSLEEWRYRVDPTILIDGDGQPRVLDCLNNRDGRVRYNSRTANGWAGEFSHYDERDWDHTGTPQPGFMLDGGGNPHALYVLHYNYDPHLTRTIYSVRTTNGWQETLLAEDERWSVPAALAMDSQGRSHLLTLGTEGRVRLTRIETGSSSPLRGGRTSRTQSPTGLSGKILAGTAVWTWTDRATNETGYRVYGSTSSQGVFVKIAELPANSVSFTESNLLSGVRYYRYVVARNMGGFASSAAASVKWSLPAAPSALTGTSPTSTSLKWTWKDNATNETGYRVRRVADNTVLVNNLPANTVSWTESGMGVNTAEQVKVEVFNADGQSASPSSSVVYTLANPPGATTLTRPGGVLTLSWSNNGNPTGTVYRGYRSPDNVVFTQIYSGTGLSSFLTGLQANTTYFFKVRAQNKKSVLTAFGPTVSTRTYTTTPLAMSSSVTGVFSEVAVPSKSEPGFRVEFSDPGNPGASILMDPVDEFPGSPPQPLRPWGGAWALSLEGFEESTVVVRPVGSNRGNRLVLGWWDESSSDWLVDDHPRPIVESGIFGVFYILPTTVENVRVYPNPFRPSKDTFLHVKDVPVGTQVVLYTLAGERVCALPPAVASGDSAETVWDGRNESGSAVASGVYLGVINGNNQKKSFRLGVEQ
jgi:fibronectin type 3 domain-containing protein